MINNLTVKDFEDNGYFADQELVDIVNASLYLNKPILIEGPAGTGKTYLAKTLSKIFKTQLIRLQCHEGIDEDKALYEWNYKKQLLSKVYLTKPRELSLRTRVQARDSFSSLRRCCARNKKTLPTDQ